VKDDTAGQHVQVASTKETFNIRVMTEVAALVALAGALQAIKVFSLPQGGSVTLAGMVPILLLSLRRGWKLGVLGGVLLGLIAIIEEPGGVYYPTQAVLDYPVAFGALGLAGFFPKLPVLGAAVGIAGRFLAHFVSGVIFFASFAPVGMSPEVYSAIYNGSYLLPELVVSAVVVQLLSYAKALEVYR
jgi:thiamine transporter